jgi:hypothetical protein
MLLLVASAYKCWANSAVVLVVDCHNKSLKKRLGGPLGGLFFTLKKWSFRQADMVIISNDGMLSPAAELSDRVHVLRDPLPVDFIGTSDNPTNEASALFESEFRPPVNPYVLFSCSFAQDEPVESILLAAVDLSRAKYSVVITGDHSKIDLPESVYSDPNIFMSSYVSDACYRVLLTRASVVVALTEDRDCLMCAAYEAVAARRPLVVSDTSVLRACFKDLATYTSNQPRSIVTAVDRALSVANNGSLEDAREQFDLAFRSEFQRLLTKLSDLGAVGISECQLFR